MAYQFELLASISEHQCSIEPKFMLLLTITPEPVYPFLSSSLQSTYTHVCFLTQHNPDTCVQK